MISSIAVYGRIQLIQVAKLQKFYLALFGVDSLFVCYSFVFLSLFLRHLPELPVSLQQFGVGSLVKIDHCLSPVEILLCYFTE
jgi:hypothetical protein